MTDKEVKQIVDENIKNLFWDLLPKMPIAVERGSLEYKIQESSVKIWWRRKYKLDYETTLPSKLTDKPFDNVTDGLDRWNPLFWSMNPHFPDKDKNPIVEGITFIIETKDGHFLVPALSRTETVKAQELIEEAYRNYTVQSVIELYKAVK